MPCERPLPPSEIPTNPSESAGPGRLFDGACDGTTIGELNEAGFGAGGILSRSNAVFSFDAGLGRIGLIRGHLGVPRSHYPTHHHDGQNDHQHGDHGQADLGFLAHELLLH